MNNKAKIIVELGGENSREATPEEAEKLITYLEHLKSG